MAEPDDPLASEVEPPKARGASTIAWMSSHGTSLALVGVLTTFLVLGMVIAIKTPAYESSDEPSHVQNIETLVSGHWYGMNSKCRLLDRFCSGDEPQQAPLYYLLFAGWQDIVGQPVQATYNGQTLQPAGGPTEIYKNHSPAALRFLLWLRIPNVVLGALTVLFTFLAVRLISSDPWTPVVAASFVAFLPRFVFLSSFVTNDNLVDLLGAALVYFAVRFIKAPNLWRISVVGVVLTTKLSTLPLALVIVALGCLVPGWKRRTQLVGAGGAAALIVSGWYLIQNTVRYGDPLARHATTQYLIQVAGLGTYFVPYKVGNIAYLIFIEVPNRIERSFWYQSGWGQFSWTQPVNILFWVVLAAALAGLIHRHLKREMLVTLGLIFLLSFACVWAVAFQTSVYQARYAYVGLAAIAGLFALGVERWRLPVRFVLPTMGLIGTLVALQTDVLAIHWT